VVFSVARCGVVVGQLGQTSQTPMYFVISQNFVLGEDFLFLLT